MERTVQATPEARVISEVNAELRRLGRSAMTKRERQVTKSDAWLDEVAEGQWSAAGLAERIVEWRDEPDVLAVPPGEEAAAVADETLGARLWALSIRVAEVAGDRPDVRSFRERYLAEGLVEWASLEDWLLGRPEPRALLHHVVMDVQETPATWSDEGMVPLRGIVQSSGCPWVSVQQPGGGMPASVPYRTGPIADGLRIVESLAAFGTAGATAWEPAQAFVWLFTGVTPLVPLLTAVPWLYEDGVPGRVRIDVDVDADPRQVAAAFRDARNRQYPPPERGGRTRRAPAVTRRGWEATAWCLLHPGGTWRARMRGFNAHADEQDRFTDWRRFAATVRSATALLPRATNVEVS